MKVLVTGASGFLGQYVVAAALRQGHQVIAMVRPKSKAERFSWHDHGQVELVRWDLRQRRGLTEAVASADAVIHLAAVKAGDFYDQFAGTVIATENLLSAMVEADCRRLIAISTFSVYDFLARPTNTLLDETFPLEDEPLNRDDYAQTKLLQERLYRTFESEQAGQVTILRPGMVYGRDNLWNACLGAPLGSQAWLRIGANGTIPLTYVENCAEAIVSALDHPESIGQTLNILDDQLPTQKEFGQALVQAVPNSPRLIPLNWTLAKSIADLAWFVNRAFLGGNARLPGILVPARLQARFKPFQYSNERAKTLLDWTPCYDLKTALERSLSSQDLLAAPSLTTISQV